MGIWTLAGTLDGEKDGAVLIDSVTMTAFGPVFGDAELADDFVAWCSREDGGRDPRALSPAELRAAHILWTAALCPACETTTCHCKICGAWCAAQCACPHDHPSVDQ